MASQQHSQQELYQQGRKHVRHAAPLPSSASASPMSMLPRGRLDEADDQQNDCVARLTAIADVKPQQQQELDEDDTLSCGTDQGSHTIVSSQLHSPISLTSLTACMRAHNRYKRRLSHHGGLDDPLLPALDEANIRRLAAALRVKQSEGGVLTPPSTPCTLRSASS